MVVHTHCGVAKNVSPSPHLLSVKMSAFTYGTPPLPHPHVAPVCVNNVLFILLLMEHHLGFYVPVLHILLHYNPGFFEHFVCF